MGFNTEPSGGRRSWFSILWGIAVLCLWGLAIVGPFLFLFGAASFFTDVGGLQMFGQPVETLRERLLFTGSTLVFAVIGLSYVIGWRRRARRDARVKWAFMAVVYLLVPLVAVSAQAYYYKSLLGDAYSTTASVRAYNAQTGERIEPPVSVSLPGAGPRDLLYETGVAVSPDGTMRISVMATRPVKLEVGAPGYISQDVEIGPDTREIDVGLQRAEDFVSDEDRPDR